MNMAIFLGKFMNLDRVRRVRTYKVFKFEWLPKLCLSITIIVRESTVRFLYSDRSTTEEPHSGGETFFKLPARALREGSPLLSSIKSVENFPLSCVDVLKDWASNVRYEICTRTELRVLPNGKYY